MKIKSIIFWKKALSGLVLILALSAVTNSVLAQSCKTNCLSVYSIALSDKVTSIGGIVKLIDDDGSAGGARSAVVHALWTRPDGTTLDQYDVIGTRLRAEFSLYTAGAPGTYTLTVVDVTKTGYTFDPQSSTTLSESITVGSAGNQLPIAVPNADVLSGAAPLTVSFDSSASSDPDGSIVDYAWEFGDESVSNEANPEHTYLYVGNFLATLTVIDNLGAMDSNSISITVTDVATGCTADCMVVDQVTMAYKKNSGTITGKVWIDDENGNPVKNALVHAMWTRPDGSTFDDYNATNKRSIAKFVFDADNPGVYTLTVVEVVKSGLTFDPDNSNVLTGMIEVSN